MGDQNGTTARSAWSRRGRIARRILLGLVSGGTFLLVFNRPALSECRQELGADSIAHQVCGPLPITSLRVVALGALLLLLAAPEFAELEAFGVRVKRLERVEGKVDQLATQINTTLVGALSARASASGGNAVANPVINLLLAGSEVQSTQPADEIMPGAEAMVSLAGAAMTGWLTGLPAPWSAGGLVGLALDPDRQLKMVGWAGDPVLGRVVVDAADGRAPFLAEALAGAEVTVDPDEGKPMIAAPAVLGDHVVGLLVAVAPEGTVPNVTSELAAELVSNAAGFGGLLGLARAPAGGQR